MRPILLLFTAALPIAFPASAMAQQAAPPDAPDAGIVVRGQPGAKPPERVFVDALAAPSGNGQLARFEDGLCPMSFGLGERDHAQIVQRIRRVADAARLPRANAGCRANVVVFVVQNRKAAIEHWRRKRPDFFAGLSQREIRALADGAGPVAAWQVVHVKGAGRRAIGRAASDMYDYLVIPEATPTRLGSQIQLEFFGSFVLIEARAIGDASLTQVADYAAMRGLASTDPEAAAAQPLPTILSLFTRPDMPVPLSLTDWDLAYLKALYDTRIAARACDQLRAMARSVKHDEANRDAK